MDNYLLRSLMFVPGHNERLINSAIHSEADVLLLDIEDSVKPESNKQIARNLIIRFLKEKKLKNHIIFPRINDRESGNLLKDLMQLSVEGVHGFMTPKAKCGNDIYFIDKLLETIEYEKGFPIGTFKLIPLIETTAAVLNAQDICKASERVISVALGCEDFISDLQGIHDIDGKSIFTARALLAYAARASKVIPIDTVHIRVHDYEDLERNLVLARKLGYEGMLVLHPKELALVHKYFSPSKKEYEDSIEMLRLAEKAEEGGRGVAVLNGKFIGPPMIKTAHKIIAKYNLIKSKEK